MWAESARSVMKLLVLALSPIAGMTGASSFPTPGIILF